MSQHDIWQVIADAGIKLRPDFANPDQWVSSVRWQQYGPFETREEAVQAAVQGLVQKIKDTEEELIATKQSGWATFFSGLLSVR